MSYPARLDVEDVAGVGLQGVTDVPSAVPSGSTVCQSALTPGTHLRVGAAEGPPRQWDDASSAVAGVTEIDWFTHSRLEPIDGRQAWLGEPEAAWPRARRVVSFADHDPASTLWGSGAISRRSSFSAAS